MSSETFDTSCKAAEPLRSTANRGAAIDLIHKFLLAVATNADPEYQSLMTGIANHFAAYHKLSSKQFSSVQAAANRQRRSIPDEVYDYLTDSRPQPYTANGPPQ